MLSRKIRVWYYVSLAI